MTDTPAAAGTLVERLREYAADCDEGIVSDYETPGLLAREAADELSACRAELARMAKTAADQARASTATPAEGGQFVVVPREPTEAMLHAWLSEHGSGVGPETCREVWSAMLKHLPAEQSEE